MISYSLRKVTKTSYHNTCVVCGFDFYYYSPMKYCDDYCRLTAHILGFKRKTKPDISQGEIMSKLEEVTHLHKLRDGLTKAEINQLKKPKKNIVKIKRVNPCVMDIKRISYDTTYHKFRNWKF